MPSDLWGFLLAVKEHWEALAPGGVLLLADLLEVFLRREGEGRSKPKPIIPHWLLRWGIVICLFIACFEAWRDEHKKVEEYFAAHPHFSVLDAQFKRITVETPNMVIKAATPSSAEFLVSLRNTGGHPASIEGSLVVVMTGLSTPQKEYHLKKMGALANDIESGSPYGFEATFSITETDIPEVFLFCRMNFTDHLTNKRFNQVWYFSWEGMKSGQAQRRLGFITTDQKEEVDAFLADQGIIDMKSAQNP